MAVVRYITIHETNTLDYYLLGVQSVGCQSKERETKKTCLLIRFIVDYSLSKREIIVQFVTNLKTTK